MDAVLFATTAAEDGGPAAMLEVGGSAVLTRLLEQLAGVGVERVSIVTRPQWTRDVRAAAVASGADAAVVEADDLAGDLHAAGAEAARQAAGPLLVAEAHVVLHREALARFATAPGASTLALAGSNETPGGGLRTVRRRVVSAASPYHRVSDSDTTFLGALRIGDREQVASVAEDLAVLAETAENDPSEAPGGAASLLLVGLVRSDRHVAAHDLGPFFYAAPLSARAATEAALQLQASDEERARLDSAVKTNDSFFTTFLVSPYSKHLARFAARRGWTPNQITAASFLVGAAAALAFAFGSRAGLVAGAVLLQASFALDCVDGQLARYTRTFSRVGSWLDSILDRLNEYLVYAGLALGSTRGFDDDVWLLAAAALALQTGRHLSDAAFVATQSDPAARPVRAPLDERDDPGAPARPAARRRLYAWADALLRSDLVHWGNWIIRLPIGERLALISVTAAVASPRVTFVALLAWGAVAAVYALTARVFLSSAGSARVGIVLR